MSGLRPGLRGRLLLSVLVGIGIVLAALTLAFNLVLDARLTRDANGLLQARTSAEIGALRISQGRVQLIDAPDEAGPELPVWVYQDRRALERPSAGAADQSAAAALARRAPATDDVNGTRLQAVPIVASGRRLGAVVAAVSLSPYEQTRRAALIASCVLALAVLLAVALAARWLISRALRPVMTMTRQASAWSDRDLDRRFSLGTPHDELTQLAATLDELLDRLATSLRHEQRLSAELSHELRTPLASIAAEAQYALRHSEQPAEGRATLERILRGADQMSRTLDTLMAAARAQLDPHGATSDATAAARAACAEVPPAIRAGIGIEVLTPSRPVRARAEQELVERILAPLIENALRHATARVQIAVAQDGSTALLRVEDDGPGIAAADLDAIFLPGRRGPAGAGVGLLATTGAGLGLALSRRLARTAGGDVIAEPGAGGGRFIVRLPGRADGELDGPGPGT
jgi:two-component system, OmpR family, sensor kinase